MAPYLLALALLFQDGSAAAASDAPVATAIPRKQDVAPLPIQGGAVTAPTDDYGYVGWCYGAISAYVDLYDRAMPEVIRIERAWPTPSTEENIAVIYPEQREEAKRNLVLFARAMEAAEKASPAAIQPQGAAAIKRGRAVWTGATNVPKAQLAQFWMSWSPPAKCAETAKTLETRSRLFGQALASPAPIVAPPPPAVEAAEAAPAILQADAEMPAPSLPPVEPAAGGLVEAAPQAPAATTDTPLADPAPAADDVVIEQPATDGPMVFAQPEPSEDPEVTVSGDAPPPPSTEALPDAAALSAGAPEPVAPTAIDDLLPTEEAAATPVTAGPEASPPVVAPAAPVVAAAPAAKPAPAATTPPARKRKRGLKETLQGMRGPQ